MRRPAAMSAESRQRGQALLEAIVGLLAMVPLLLALLWLGKVLALRQSVIQGARLAAFECTVRPALCDQAAGQARLATEVHERVFGPTDGAVRSAAAGGAGGRLAPWSDAAGRPLIADTGDVSVQVAARAFDAGSAVAAGGLAGVLDDRVGPARFGLDAEGGLRVLTVEALIRRSGAGASFWPALRLRSRAAVLTDAWQASAALGAAADTTETRVRRGAWPDAAWEASLDAREAPARLFLGAMDAMGLEPMADRFRPREVDVRILPPDRVGEAR